MGCLNQGSSKQCSKIAQVYSHATQEARLHRELSVRPSTVLSSVWHAPSSVWKQHLLTLDPCPDRLSPSGSSAKYSRLEAEISAMQRNSSTYCDEPEDCADYRVSLRTLPVPCCSCKATKLWEHHEDTTRYSFSRGTLRAL